MKKRYTFIYIFLLTVSTVIYSLNRFFYIEHDTMNLVSSYIDGAVVWASDRIIILCICPILVIFLSIIYKQRQYNSLVVYRYKSRINLWLHQELRLFVYSAFTAGFVMLICSFMAYLLNTYFLETFSINEFTKYRVTYLQKTAAAYDLNLSEFNINPLVLYIQTLLLNSLDIFLIVTISNSIEWISNTYWISIFIPYCFSIATAMNYQLVNPYITDVMNLRSYPHDYYFRLININEYIKFIVLIILLTAVIIFATAPYVKKRDYISGGF